MNKQINMLAKNLGEQLKEKRWMLATAESCTGGLVAAAITDIPGSSAWFDRGFVTYANDAKVDLLSVSQYLLTNYGAVSLEVAKAMAEGALANSQAQVAVATTGVAGPDGGSRHKPVGTVCFALAIEHQETKVFRYVFSGDRQAVRVQSVEYVLLKLLRCL